MLDERGMDYGVLTSIGLVIASAVILLLVFSMYRSTAPSNEVIALESAASEVGGDIDTVAAMGIPYASEKSYGFNGINVSISADHVTATAGCRTFARPLASRICPGRFKENDTLLWNDIAGLRELLNASFNATGTREDPIGDNRSSELRSLMERASRSTLMSPIPVPLDKPVIFEKAFIYTYDNASKRLEVEPFVFVRSKEA